MIGKELIYRILNIPSVVNTVTDLGGGGTPPSARLTGWPSVAVRADALMQPLSLCGEDRPLFMGSCHVIS